MGTDQVAQPPAGADLVTDASIARALTAVSKGDSSQYNKLLSELKDVQLDNEASVSALLVRLRALAQTGSYMDERLHDGLLTHVLGLSIWVFSSDVADALLRFVVNLVTANGACILPCLEMLVRNFLPPSCGMPQFIDSYHKQRWKTLSAAVERARASKDEHMAKKDETLDRLHKSISVVLELVPMAYLRLQRIVLRRMPHKVTAKEWIALYLENMLRLESSVAGDVTCGQMLPAIVDKLIEIDVEIRWEDILREDDSSKVYLFHMDLEDGNEENERDAENLEVSDPSVPGSEAKVQHGLMSRSAKSRPPSLDEMADKMDVMMDMMLQHLRYSVDKGNTPQIFKILLGSFQSTILDTYKSKFTQFLLFYLCSLAPASCGRSFAILLCDILTSRSRPPNTRMSSAAYLASYLARARYLPLSTVAESLKRVADWCLTYVRAFDEGRAIYQTPNAAHGVFYSACQAVMYVFCFKSRELLEDPEQKRVVRSLHLQELFDHRLNPLKMCLPSVVDEFVKQTSSLQLLECKDLGAHNRKENPQSSFGGEYRLDMFFPFDPYLLRQSERHIRPSFLYWSMVHPPSDEYTSDVEEEEDADVAGAAGSSWDMDDGKSLVSEMDDSPGGPQVYFQDAQAPDDDYAFSFEESIEHMSISTLPARLPAVLQRTQ